MPERIIRGIDLSYVTVGTSLTRYFACRCTRTDHQHEVGQFSITATLISGTQYTWEGESNLSQVWHFDALVSTLSMIRADEEYCGGKSPRCSTSSWFIATEGVNLIEKMSPFTVSYRTFTLTDIFTCTLCEDGLDWITYNVKVDLAGTVTKTYHKVRQEQLQILESKGGSEFASTWDETTWDGPTWDELTWDELTWDETTWDETIWGEAPWDETTWRNSSGSPTGLYHLA
jgi:hypothetical protein